MAENLKSASFAAGLSPAEQKKIDDLNKILNVHRGLSNLPSDVAKTVYKEKTPGQQQALVESVGEEDPIQKPNAFNSFVKTNDIKEARLEKYRNAILNTKN